MPEEKVSQPDTHFEPKWVCRNCGKVDNLHSSDGRCLTNRVLAVPPAVDAGPRQPDEHIGNLELRDGALWQCVGNAEHGGLRWKLVLTSELVQAAIDAPPVPQEAAPREVFIYGVPPDEVAELDKQADEAHAPLEAAHAKATSLELGTFGSREFCEGCDHGVVAGKVCELCGGTGYKERRRKVESERERELSGMLQMFISQVHLATLNDNDKLMFENSVREAKRLVELK